MKLLHLSDTHLGTSWFLRGATPGWTRHQDHLQAMRTALRPALRGEVDLVVHTGDLFDRSRPPRRAALDAIALLREVAAVVPVVVLRGNHDRRGLTLHLPLGIPGLRVVDEACTLDVAGARIAAVPYTRDPLRWAQEARAVTAGGVDVLLAHQAFDGVEVPGFRFRPGRPPDTIPAGAIPEGVPLVLCGHLHPRQVIELAGVPIVHPGSIERTSWSERAQTKGAAFITLGRTPNWAFVDLPSRPLVVVDSEHGVRTVQPGSVARLVPHLQTPEIEDAVLDRGAWLAPPRTAPPGRAGSIQGRLFDPGR